MFTLEENLKLLTDQFKELSFSALLRSSSRPPPINAYHHSIVILYDFSYKITST